MCINPEYRKTEGSDNDGLQRTCRAAGPDALSAGLLQALETSVVFFDMQGVILRANDRAWEDLHADEGYVGRKLSELLSVVCRNENILPGLLARLGAADAGTVRLPADTFVCCAERGMQFFAEGSFSRLECGCCLLSFRNITEEKTREQILYMALTRSKIFPWFFDMDRNRMLIDTGWFAYLGIPAGDGTLLSEEFFDRVHPEDREMLSEALRQQLSDHEIPDSFAYRLRRGDGSWEWFSEQSVYLGQTNDGLPYRIVGVCQSIQDHKTIEENLRAARDKAQESDRLKSAFLANVSHEIRTPLNAIVGFSDLFAGGEILPGSGEAAEYAALIGRNSEHLLALVSDILDLSRSETDSMEYCFTEYSLAKILSDVYTKYSEMRPGGVALNLLPLRDDVRIVTDGMRIRQVMGHLVGNAMKFTREGHIDLGCELSDDGSSVRLFVSDTGIGIPPQLCEKVFERFYKVDSFMQGAGLGLSVCKNIVEGLHGTISVSSRPQEGSCFSVRLPLQP